MASAISPGVYSKIIDLSEYLTSTSGTIGFVPIVTEKGPDNVLTRVSSIEEYRTKFGDPNLRTFGKYYGQGPYVALQHLSVSSDLFVMRALPDDATYSHAYVCFTGSQVTADSVDSSADDASDVDDSKTPSEATDSGAADSLIGLTTFSCYKKFKPTISSSGVGGLKYLDMTNTQKLDAMFTSAQSGQVYALTDGKAYCEKENDYNKSVLFYVRGFGRGDYYDRYSFMLRADSNPSNFGLYNFEVYEDQDGSPVMVESYNISFDPESTDLEGESNYIEDVINGFSTNIQVQVNSDALARYNSFLAEFYKNDPTIEESQPDYVIDKGFPTTDEETGYSLIPEYVGEDDLDTVRAEAGVYIGTTKISKSASGEYEKGIKYLPAGYELGTKATAIWNAYFDKAVAQEEMAYANSQYIEAVDMGEDDTITKTIDGVEKQLNRSEAIDRAIGLCTAAQELVNAAQEEYEAAVALSLMSLNDSDDILVGEQPYYLNRGSMGGMVIVKGGVKTVQPMVANQTLALAYTGLLKKPVVVRKVDESTGSVTYKIQYANDVLDLDWIYFTIVYDAGYKPDVKQAAKELVESRLDCVLISDCGDNSDCEDVEKYTGAVKGAKDCRIWNSFYCARYEPYTRVYDKFLGCDNWMSPVYTMAKLIPTSDALYDVWYAAAGYTRGVSSEIKELRWSANKGERDRLYLAQVNPIVHFPEGMTVWGQLTTQKKSSALSDLNCVRTVLYCKRAIEQFCKYFIFEFNDKITHERIKAGIVPFLQTVQAARGLKSFSVDVGATDYEFKTKTCHVNVMLQPMKVIEKIMLNLYIQ